MTEPLLEIGVPFLKTLVYPVFPDVVPIKFAFDARYLPSYQKLWIDRLDVSNFPDKKSVKEVRLELLREGESLLEKPIPLSGDAVKNLGIPIPNLVQQEGDYTITVSLLDAAGKTLASDSKSFWWKQMPFVQSPVPDFQGLLPPFTSLALEGKQVSVIGRTYVLNDLALFDQIIAEQLEPTVGKPTDSLLQRPLSFSLESDGQTITASPVGQLKVKASSNQYTVVEGQGNLGDIQLNITNRIEYDGLAWIEIELNPTKPVRVSSLSFDIPVRESQATLLHEVTDAIRRTYAGLTPTGTGTVWDSKRLLNTDGTLGNFKPLYWLGNEDRGLCWTGESDQGWYLDDEKPAIEVVRKPGEVVLRLNLINRGLLLSKPRTISFGLQATPVKPMPKGWRGWVAPYGPAEFQNLQYFNFGPVGNQDFFAAVVYAPYPRDYAVAKEKMDESRARGSIPFLYQVLRGAVPDIPEVKAYLDEWGKVAYYGAKSFDEFRSWVLTQYLKRAGLHAYYEDNAYLSPVKDPAQGYGYVREDGQYQGRFPVRRMREYLRRQAAVYHTLGMPNYLAVHKSTTMMPPCYSFVTFAIDGEQRFMNSPDTDYIDQFPLDYFRTHIMGRQFGFVPIFLSEIHLGAGKKEAIKKGTRSEFALLWLHEIISWPAYDLDQATLDNSIRAIGEFDLGAPDVVFHPYWEKDKVATTDSKDVVATLWERPRKALAVVANLGDEKRTKVTFDFSKLKLKPQSVADFESKEKLPLQDSVLELSIPRHDYRLIWME